MPKRVNGLCIHFVENHDEGKKGIIESRVVEIYESDYDHEPVATIKGSTLTVDISKNTIIDE